MKPLWLDPAYQSVVIRNHTMLLLVTYLIEHFAVANSATWLRKGGSLEAETGTYLSLMPVLGVVK